MRLASVGIAAGVAVLWMLVVVQITSSLRRQLGKTTWHRIHLVSYARPGSRRPAAERQRPGQPAGGLVRGG
jgi:hypothetical protein